MAAPTQFAYRTLKGIGIVDAAPAYAPLPGFDKPEGNFRCCTYSPCGRYFAWATSKSVEIIDASTGEGIASLPADNVFEVGFSPLGTYVITWQRPNKDDAGNTVRNLKVWKVIDEVEERVPVGAFFQRSQTNWNLQWTPDELHCARAVTNEVHLYDCKDFSAPWNKLRVEGVTDFALSPGKNSKAIAVFVPERKGQPASLEVYNVPQFAHPISKKSFYRCDKVQFHWNNSGTTCLVLASTESDASGKSYFGTATLYILSAVNDFSAKVDIDKEGSIHDVHWSPNSKEFGVVYGFMPAKTTIYNVRAAPIHSFPIGPRNTILFSPHGRFVLVAGFGNLAGQIDIYDLEKKFSKVSTIQASNSSVCQWSPDGIYILTATTSPRLRVDNGVKLWHVSGSLMYHQALDELYQVCWRPVTPELSLVEDPFNDVPKPHSSALTYLGTVKTPSKPAGAYRPPGARGQVTPLAFKREDEGGAVFVSNHNGISGLNGTFGKPRRAVPGAELADGLPPGAAPGGGVSLTLADGDGKISKSAARNKKKREAKKAREAAEKDIGLKPETSRSRSSTVTPSRSPSRRGVRNHERSRSKDPAGHIRSRSTQRPTTRGGHTSLKKNGSPPAPIITAVSPQKPLPSPDVQITSPTGGGGTTPHDKKMRSLLKKMRAIEDLKMRLANGEKLEDTQMKKIGTEENVRKELEGLGWQA